MTCAPNAFASGHGLLRLDLGQTITTRWGIEHDQPEALTNPGRSR